MRIPLSLAGLTCVLLGVAIGQNAPMATGQPTFSQSVVYQPREFPTSKSKKQSKNTGESPASSVPASAAVDQRKISIPISILDASGKFVTGLEASNFRVFVDGKKVDITSVSTRKDPLNVILLVDRSNSTVRYTKAMQLVATSIVEQLNPDDRVAILRHDGKNPVLTDLTDDRDGIRRAIRKIDVGGEGTSLYDSIRFVFEKHIPSITGRSILLVLSDGVDTTAKYSSYEQSLEWAEKGNTPIYPIFFDTLAQNLKDPGKASSNWVNGGISSAIATEILEKEKARNRLIAASHEHAKLYLNDLVFLSGGRAVAAKDFQDSPRETASAMIADIRQQYFLTFSPNQPAIPGQRKQLLVRVDRPNLAILARGSYIVKPY